VVSGLIAFPKEQAEQVLQNLRKHMPTTPRELMVVSALTQCPPLPPVDPKLYGQPVLMLVVVYTGPVEKADAIINGLASLGTSFANIVGANSWLQTNSMLDAIAPYGRRVYTRGGYLKDIGDDAIKIGVERWLAAPPPDAPGPSTVQNFWFMGAGAISEDFSEDSVAFSREGTSWFWECVSQWDNPANDDAFERWTVETSEALRSHMRANGYVNLTSDQGPEWLRGLYGPPAKYQRLLDAKKAWDPHNLLRFNKNFKPE